MSASAREPGSSFDDEPSDRSPEEDAPQGDAAIRDRAPGPICDAPKAARLSTPSARTEATEASQPPWKRPRRAFAGDVAMAELRNDLVEMSELPGQAPEPPKSAVYGAKVLIVVATAAAAGAVAYLWSSPNADRMDVASAARELPAPLEQPQLPATRVVPAPTAQPSPAPVSALRSFFSQSDEASSRERARQLTIKAARLWQVDAPARLIASPVDDSWNVDVVISGLAFGSAMSVGTPAGPNGWRLPIRDLNRAAITPPRGFVGTMDLTMELRLTNDTVIDRKGVLLEWSHNSTLAIAPFPPRLLEAAEIKLMVKSGLEYMANGKVGAARLMFQSAAEAGEAAAAFALAETYDPIVLEKLGVKGGITPDVAVAQRWYEKAKELGSSTAPERIARLTRRSE
jgi:hypothetical protein